MSGKNVITDALTPSKSEIQNEGIYSWLRSGTGLLPGVGTAISEYLTKVEPDWRFKRIRNVLIYLDRRVSAVENGQEAFSRNINKESGADLLQEGIEQAERAITDFRQEILGRILAKSLTKAEIDHEQDFLLLSTLRSLSEYELIHLIFFATRSGQFKFDSEAFRKQHKEILEGRQSHLQSTPEERNAAITQQQYKALLAQKGLLENGTKLSGFGRLLFESLDIEDD